MTNLRFQLKATVDFFFLSQIQFHLPRPLPTTPASLFFSPTAVLLQCLLHISRNIFFDYFVFGCVFLFLFFIWDVVAVNTHGNCPVFFIHNL